MLPADPSTHRSCVFTRIRGLNVTLSPGLAMTEFRLMWKANGDSDWAKEQFDKAMEIYEELKLGSELEKVRNEQII